MAQSIWGCSMTTRSFVSIHCTKLTGRHLQQLSAAFAAALHLRQPTPQQRQQQRPLPPAGPLPAACRCTPGLPIPGSDTRTVSHLYELLEDVCARLSTSAVIFATKMCQCSHSASLACCRTSNKVALVTPLVTHLLQQRV